MTGMQVSADHAPLVTVLHLDIYLCKYTNIKDTAEQSVSADHVPLLTVPEFLLNQNVNHQQRTKIANHFVICNWLNYPMQ